MNDLDPPSGLRFAHLSDPHLTTLEAVRWNQLLSKRVLGYLSWRRGRRAEHRSEVLDALVEDMRERHPGHVVVTGDLTHIGLPDEFRQARNWLERLGEGSEVTVVPGNHDAYARHAWSDTFSLWEPWMRSDPVADHPPATGRDGLFPSLRIRNGVAFIGLSSAVTTAPFLATGKLGAAQLTQLASVLREAGSQGMFRVVLLHHPPGEGAEKWRKRLTDTAALGEVLAECGAELILHGHSHRTLRSQIQSEGGDIPVFGIPSASAVGRKPGRAAQYYLYDVRPDGAQWRVGVSVRAYQRERHCFTLAHEHHLSVPRIVSTKC
ncbi:putative phosphohydrolases, Icc family [hydrothermal vent metagenome]|uniref:Putative phosphohydrolases, Icc family n=1 Tax=hydrothermal vent metagenome TaxID=652676 RepID=A0A3B0YI55_9ZZZZ